MLVIFKSRCVKISLIYSVVTLSASSVITLPMQVSLGFKLSAVVVALDAARSEKEVVANILLGLSLEGGLLLGAL